MIVASCLSAQAVELARFERAVPVARWQDGHPNILFVGDTEYDRRTALEAGVSFHLVQDDRDLQALRQRLVGRS